ncbi:MAG: hypothetical protein H6Q90_3385 [Deltaproteobacteria bacterium]|nr:hypothetical protein [Deltaproteobacteria bacterium]
MRIGTMFLGTVDSVQGESIQTKFFVLGVPLIPMSSHYVLSESAGGITGFEIPLNGKSVGLGYLRIASWIVALLCGVFYFIDRRRPGSLFGWMVAFSAIATISTFVLGRLSKAEQLRRGLLKSITGVGAPPSLLPRDVCEETANRLRSAWEADNEGRAWDRDVEAGKADVLLFAVAEYHHRPDLAQQVLAQLGRQGTEQGAQGPYR